MRKSLVILLIVVMMLTYVTGCAPKEQATPTPGGNNEQTTLAPSGNTATTPLPSDGGASVKYAEEIIWGTHIDQAAICPHNNNAGDVVVGNVYSGLVQFDGNMNIVPDLATEWSVAEDGCTWTFKVRSGVKFHNGKTMTLDDVYATFSRIVDKENPVRVTTSMSYLKEFYIEDEETFVIVTHTPVGAFLSEMAAKRGGILDKEYIEKYGSDLGYTTESINGTGPYKVVTYKLQEELVFEAHDDYYGGAPITKRIVMPLITESNARSVAIETGQVDMVSNVVAEDIGRLDSLPNLVAVLAESNGCHLFQFNCHTLPDPKVRQAICYAIDKESLVAALFAPLQEEPMRNIMAPSILGWADLGVYPYDPERAKELLSEAGFPGGFEIKLMTTNIYNRGVEMAEVIKEDLAKVGIIATIQEIDRATFNASLGGNTREEYMSLYGYDMYVMGSGGSSDPDTLLKRIWKTDANGTNVNNYGFYSNPTADALFDKAATMVDPVERAKVYREISQILYYDDPVGVFLNLRKNVYILKDTIEGYAPNSNNRTDWTKLVMRVN